MSIRDAETGQELAQHFSRTGPVSGVCTIVARHLLAERQVGDVVTLRIIVSDNNPELRPPFEHCVEVTVKGEASPPNPPPPPAPGLDLPVVTEVWKAGSPGWADLHDSQEFVFDHQTAVQIRRNSSGATVAAFDIFINMDNANLDRARRRARSPDEIEMLNTRWRQVFEFLTLGFISDHSRSLAEDNGRKAEQWYEESPGSFVYHATRSLAPLVPVLGSLFVAKV